MNGTVALLIFCGVVAFAVALCATIIVLHKPHEGKRYSYKHLAKFDDDAPKTDENILYDKEARGAVDGSSANKEFKKGK